MLCTASANKTTQTFRSVKISTTTISRKYVFDMFFDSGYLHEVGIDHSMSPSPEQHSSFVKPLIMLMMSSCLQLLVNTCVAAVALIKLYRKPF